MKWNTTNEFKMADPRWPMIPDPSLIINDVNMKALLSLKIAVILANFLILFDTSLFMFRLKGIIIGI